MPTTDDTDPIPQPDAPSMRTFSMNSREFYEAVTPPLRSAERSNADTIVLPEQRVVTRSQFGRRVANRTRSTSRRIHSA